MTIDQVTDYRQWDPRSASWRLSAVAGSALVGLGFFGLTRPCAASDAFGMPIQRPHDANVWRPKAARDLATGVMTLALLAQGDKRALGTYATACALIPTSDAVIVVRGGSRNRWQVAMHAAMAGLTLALGASLLRGEG